MKLYTLYAAPVSLYSAKVRAYLRKQGIPFEEVPRGCQHYREHVFPKIGRNIVPVIETPDGQIIQDSTDIIDHFEQAGLGRRSAHPSTPRQAITALIFELFGGEGLLRPAMHFRWNFPSDNAEFIRSEFAASVGPGVEESERMAQVDNASERMRQATFFLGVTPETEKTVEASYTEFLDLFDVHLKTAPYLLGGRPSIGDYGLIGPLYAHMGRDPYPAKQMKQRAVAVWRWTERMNAYEEGLGNHPWMDSSFFPDDAIPDTLIALMRYVAEEYLDEITAHVEFINGWLDEHTEIQAGDLIGGKPSHRSLGLTPLCYRGHDIQISVLPYRVYLLQRIQDAYANLERNAQQEVNQLLGRTGLQELLTLKARRRIERRNNKEVWGS